MTAESTNITDMTDQLRSLSLESEPTPPMFDDSHGAVGDDGGWRPRRWRWTAALVLALGTAAAAAWFTEPGRDLVAGLGARIGTTIQGVMALEPGDAPVATKAAQSPAAAAHVATAPINAPPHQIIGSGYSRAERDVILGAPFPGRIESVWVAEGDIVKLGDPLVQKENRAAREAVEQAARLRLRQLEEAQKRFDSLVARGAALAMQAEENTHALGSVAFGAPEEAWLLAEARFPADPRGSMMHQMASATSDSAWYRQLSDVSARQAGSRGTYWLHPFSTYKTFCPYLVGSYEAIADCLRDYIAQGVTGLTLDVPPVTEEDVASAATALDLATAPSSSPVLA